MIQFADLRSIISLHIRAGLRLAALAAALSLTSAPAEAASPAPENPVVATVNGISITRAQVIGADPKAAKDKAAFDQTLQRFINTVLLYQVAMQDKLDQTPAVRAATENAREQILVNAAQAAWLKGHPIKESAIKARYRKLLQTLPKEEWRLREIVVADRRSADAVLRALRNGRRFSDLAAEHPDSPNSVIGGELGWVDPRKLPAAVERAVRPRKVGQVVGPIPVPQGLAIVQQLGRRPPPKPPLKALRAGIEQQLRNESLSAYLKELKKKADITVNAPETPKKGK
jgi:peptidyl-prolyl cis-trans isomerase C